MIMLDKKRLLRNKRSIYRVYNLVLTYFTKVYLESAWVDFCFKHLWYNEEII